MFMFTFMFIEGPGLVGQWDERLTALVPITSFTWPELARTALLHASCEHERLVVDARRVARALLRSEVRHPRCISATSPPYLPYISPVSPLHLPCISAPR